MRLYLVRHPQPAVAPGVCYGATDLALVPSALADVLPALRAALPKNVPLFSSPLRRCADLARRLSDTPPRFDARLVEMNFGAWEMRAWDEIARAEIDAWSNDVAAYRPGGAESVREMAERVSAFYADMLRAPGESAIVICHAGTIRLLLACHQGLSPRAMAEHAGAHPRTLAYGEIVILER